MTFKINNILIGQKFPTRLIAEISSNHKGSFKRMMKLIKIAKKSQVDLIKIQTYKPETMTINSKRKEFLIKNSKHYKGTLYDLYKKAHTPWEWHKDIFDLCKKLKIPCFSTPFDKSAVEFLYNLNVPAFKISSFECNDLPLIKEVAQTNKPTIISTGLASKKEISESVNFFRKYSKAKLMLLKCTSSYPAKYLDLNLMTINDMRSYFNCEVGFSDHTKDNLAAIVASNCGAALIEKHFNIDDKITTPDSHFSGTSKQFYNLAKDLKSSWEIKGKILYGATNSEKNNLKSRRSIYYVRDIKKGEKVTSDSIKIIRPALGTDPKNYFKIIGKKIKTNVKYGTPVKLKHFLNK